MIISSRSAAEYRAMFGLTPANLAVPEVLDCCAGGSSFTSETVGRVVAADPAYALDRHDLARRVRACRRVQHPSPGGALPLPARRPPDARHPPRNPRAVPPEGDEEHAIVVLGHSRPTQKILPLDLDARPRPNEHRTKVRANSGKISAEGRSMRLTFPGQGHAGRQLPDVVGNRRRPARDTGLHAGC